MTEQQTETYLSTLSSLLAKGMVLYAPKSAKALKLEYPELLEYEEFKVLNDHEMLFVWGWACVSSPYTELKETQRLEPCIEFAYPTEAQRKMKRTDFDGAKFPSHIQLAIGKMASLNLVARIEEMAFLLQLRENCKRTIAQDVTTMVAEDEDRYWANVSKARKEMIETRHVVERGALGLSEEDETFVPKIKKGLIGLYHKNHR